MRKDVWNCLYVSSFGELVGVARKVSHHLLYSPCMSSFRCFDVVLEMVYSDTWKWLRILHALFHQENLALAAGIAVLFWL